MSDEIEFQQVVGDLLELPEVQHLKQFHHHHKVSRYEHTVLVARWSYSVAKRFHLDADMAARMAMLHDLYFHETFAPDKRHGVHPVLMLRHLIDHGDEAAENAEKLMPLSEKERNIISAHMWPVSRHLPRSAEAFVVDFVDTFSAVVDFIGRNPIDCDEVSRQAVEGRKRRRRAAVSTEL